jgi:hypothetical protein
LHEQHDDNAPESPSQLQMLTLDGTVLDDDDSLEGFTNEQELHVCFPISDNEWELVDIVSTETQMME